MNISSDILRMLYQQSLSSVGTSGIGNTNGESGLTGDETSFLGILNEVMSKNSLNKSMTATSGNKQDSNSELSLALSLLMQQITGSNLTGQYQIDEILNTLKDSNGLNIEALTGIAENLSSNSSDSNIDNLIEALQELKQSKANDSQENIIDTMGLESATYTEAKANRSFPKEIMDSINAARQAHELIRARINQIRDFTGRANVGQVDTLNNIEELLANGLTGADLQNLKVSLISADDSNNTPIVDSILDIEEIGNTGQPLLNAELLSAEAGLQNTGENSSTSKDKSRTDIIDESILNSNAVSTAGTQTDNKANKVGNELATVKESVLEQIKDQVLTMRANGKQAITMHLKPEELGNLEIKMVLEKGNLSIEILTSNAKAHSLILSSIPELENVLKNSMASDRNFMNFENAKQLSEENARQNNHGYNGQHSQQQEQNDNKNGHEEFYTTSLEDSEKVDFYTAFSRMREAREQIFSKNNTL